MTHASTPPGPLLEAILVAIPARDEEKRIVTCLESVHRATAHLHLHHDCPVLVSVAADTCRDRTAALAEALGAHVTPLAVHSVGLARDAAIRRGLAVLGSDPRRTWVANTDADSVVPPEWLLRQADLAARGCDVMTGTVEPDQELSQDLVDAWHERHSLGEGHPHVHGANLGVRASTWEQLGGFGHLDVHEDAALVHRARDEGLVVVATDMARVRTSGRLVNRAPGGFGGYLRSLTDAV